MTWSIRIDVYSLHNDVTVVWLRHQGRRNPSRFLEKEECAANQNCCTCRNTYEAPECGPRWGTSHGWFLTLDYKA
jgi:hypothetical protein